MSPNAEPEVLPEEETPKTDAIALRRTDTPVTLSELAAMKGEAMEVIAARVQIIETLRKASIRATSPEDWLLFRAPEEQGGQIVGYLQDAGGDRVRDLWGIEVFNVSKPERVDTNDPAIFHYIITGSGRCKLTRQTIENVEGGRSSTDDFCKGKSGADLELAVRKAARANLDGGITRELAGMKSVPMDELKLAWEGSPKKIDQCRRGRGFGTRDERVGGASSKAPDVDPPICSVCGATGVYRPGKDGRGAFYGCPKYQEHKNRKWTVDAEKWVAEQQRDPKAPNAATGVSRESTRAPAGTAGARGTTDKVEPPPVGDMFGGREPGQEG